MASITSTRQNSLKKTPVLIDPLGLAPLPEDNRQRFLQFNLLEEYRVLLSLQTIAEIWQIRTSDILPIPEISSSMLGVCNWRGEIIWLADLNALVGNHPLWHQIPLFEHPIVVVIQTAQKTVGLVVPQVNDIELIDPQAIQQNAEDLYPPAIAPYVKGYLSDSLSIILNAEAIIKHLCEPIP